MDGTQSATRVTILAADRSSIEIHSVGLGDDPFAHAYQLTKRPYRLVRPMEGFRIEYCGKDYVISAQEINDRQGQLRK